MANPNEDGAAYSYNALRTAIGLLGLLLPLLLAIGTGFQSMTSVSDYYYTNMRDLFVGVIFFLTLFLAFYRPYNKPDKNEGRIDTIISIISAVAAGLLALFPTYNATLHHTSDDIVPRGLVLNFVSAPVSGQLHNIGSGVLFTAFAIMSIFVFTQTGFDAAGKRIKATGKKLIRNVLFVIFGVGILACIGFIGWNVIAAHGDQHTIDTMVIFAPEATALVLFGLSWLVKGKAFPFLND
jgi:hypothetical protein